MRCLHRFHEFLLPITGMHYLLIGTFVAPRLHFRTLFYVNGFVQLHLYYGNKNLGIPFIQMNLDYYPFVR